MEIKISDESITAKKITIKEGEQEIGRVRIIFIKNDLHQRCYAYIEDLYVEEDHRNKGVATQLMHAFIAEAKNNNCYKIVGTSRLERERVHQFYLKLGFKESGKEFRLNLE